MPEWATAHVGAYGGKAGGRRLTLAALFAATDFLHGCVHGGLSTASETAFRSPDQAFLFQDKRHQIHSTADLRLDCNVVKARITTVVHVDFLGCYPVLSMGVECPAVSGMAMDAIFGASNISSHTHTILVTSRPCGFIAASMQPRTQRQVLPPHCPPSSVPPRSRSQ